MRKFYSSLLTKKSVLFFNLLIITCFSAKAQLTVDNTTMTPEQLVQNVLVGTGVTVSNVTWNGSAANAGIVQEQAGHFSGVTGTVSLTNGVILGSGDVTLAIGPNAGGAGSAGGTGDSGVDPDLTAIASNDLYDEAVLEFDFVPQGDSIKFKYVFASEEYPEFVCSGFNDVFGFFISGPNPAGGSYTAQNLAIIPGSGGLPVTINSVNPGVVGSSGVAGGCTSLAYSAYYVDNTGGVTVEYDGLTVTLTAEAAVTCGETYHIKLALSDVGDGGYDSGVFLEAGSFSSNSVEVTLTTPTSTSFINGSIYENCILGTTATFYLVRPDAGAADTIPFSFSGSAVLGMDFTSSTPDTFAIFPAGQDSAWFGVTIINDGVTEPLDSLIVSVFNINLCGDTIVTTGTLYIHDPLIIVATAPNDTIPCAGQPVTLNGTATGSPLDFTYQWTGPGLSSTSASTTYNPPGAVDVIFTATDECGYTDSDTASIVIVPVPVNANGGPDQTVSCPGTTVNLNGSGSLGTTPYTYSWTGPGLSVSTASTSYAVSASTPVYFTVTDVCGQTDTDTVQLTIVPVPIVANAGPDITVACPGDVVNLSGTTTGGTGTVNFVWSNTGVIATTPTVAYTPAASQTIVLGVSDACGQTDTDTLQVTVPVPSPFNISYDPTYNVLCPGDGALLTFDLNSGGIAPYTYTWSNFVTGIDSAYYTVSTDPTIATVVIEDNCGMDTTLTYTITISDFSPLVITAVEGELCYKNDLLVQVPVTLTGGAGGNVFYWTGPAGTGIVHDYPSNAGVISNPLSGTYVVTVVDQCGNTDRDTTDIVVFPCEIHIPNIITPNGDGVNDVIHIENLEYHPGSSLVIFNRWGQIKYENPSYQNDYRPSDLTDGVYYYIVKLTDGTDPAEYTGTIHINRTGN